MNEEKSFGGTAAGLERPLGKHASGMFLARGRVPRRKAQVGKAFVPCSHPARGKRLSPSQSLRDSSPRAGAKGKTDCHVGRWPPRNDMRYTSVPGMTGVLPSSVSRLRETREPPSPEGKALERCPSHFPFNRIIPVIQTKSTPREPYRPSGGVFLGKHLLALWQDAV